MAIPAKTNAEATSLTPTVLLNLFMLDMSPIGINTQFYFCDMTTSSYKSIVYNGITYLPFPIQVKEMGYNGQGSLVRPKLQVSNINGFVSNILLQNQDLVGANVSITRVFSRFIDAVNWPNGVSPYTPDPNAAYAPEIYFINRKTQENQQVVEWELSTSFELDNRKLPSRIMLAQFCSWRFRERGTCGYQGGPISDANGNLFTGSMYNISTFTNRGSWLSSNSYSVGDYVTIYSNQQSLLNVPLVFVCINATGLNNSPLVSGNTYWVQDSCQKTLLACRLHYPQPTATPVVLPFGGFGGLTRVPYVAGYSTQNT
jgi:lambda family phage minor tail protein L